MYALVIDNQIEQIITAPKSLVIGDVRYPAKIFQLWTTAEKEAIGIYEVVTDSSNFKDEEYYVNTNEQYNFADGQVTRSWGNATAKNIADTLWTEKDKTDGLIPEGEDVGDVATRGLKYIKKEMIDNQCAGLLAPSDWRVVKATETGGTMDSGWKTWRASVRTKCNSMQTQIDNASDVDALAALFTYTEQEDGSITRPLGEFPIKE